MKADYYNAVVYRDAVVCLDCLRHYPIWLYSDEENEWVPDPNKTSPVFADSEWDSYPTCDVCHQEQDYVKLTDDGRKWLARQHQSPAVREFLGVEPDEELPAYAWPGGYPIVYLDRDNTSNVGVICPECANKADWSDAYINRAYLHYEGPPEVCENCGREIPSAYGDPDQPESEKEGGE